MGASLRAHRTALFVTAIGASIGILAGSPAGQTTAPPPQGAQVPSFRAGIDVVSLNVTVTEAGAGTPRYVTDLESGDFEVFENGVKQDVTVFNKSNSPIALSLLMDSSASMEDKLQTAQEAAIGFARKLRAQDLAQVIDFDSRALVTQSFTNDAAMLERAIRQASAGGPTAMYQALYISMSEFKKLKKTDTTSEAPRRQAVVLLSDGVDTSSLFSFDDILDSVKRSETAVYTIGLQSSDQPSSKGFPPRRRKKGNIRSRSSAWPDVRRSCATTHPIRPSCSRPRKASSRSLRRARICSTGSSKPARESPSARPSAR